MNDDVFNPEYHDWRSRLNVIVETMREMSRQTDPQAMVAAYVKRMRQLLPADASISLSRRDLPAPQYRITRFSGWPEPVNPWKQQDRLPVFDRGRLGELLYGDEPRIIQHLDVAEDDPAAEYLAGQQSLLAIPLYDQGVALNMVVIMRRKPEAFSPESLPTLVWMANLFGRATHNLVLSEQLREAYDVIDHEMRVVADIQRSLLARNLPRIPTLDVAAQAATTTTSCPCRTAAGASSSPT